MCLASRQSIDTDPVVLVTAIEETMNKTEALDTLDELFHAIPASIVDTAISDLADLHAELRAFIQSQPNICGVGSQSGPNREVLACGYIPGHQGEHSWASLPTWPA